MASFQQDLSPTSAAKPRKSDPSSLTTADSIGRGLRVAEGMASVVPSLFEAGGAGSVGDVFSEFNKEAISIDKEREALDEVEASGLSTFDKGNALLKEAAEVDLREGHSPFTEPGEEFSAIDNARQELKDAAIIEGEGFIEDAQRIFKDHDLRVAQLGSRNNKVRYAMTTAAIELASRYPKQRPLIASLVATVGVNLEPTSSDQAAADKVQNSRRAMVDELQASSDAMNGASLAAVMYEQHERNRIEKDKEALEAMRENAERASGTFRDIGNNTAKTLFQDARFAAGKIFLESDPKDIEGRLAGLKASVSQQFTDEWADLVNTVKDVPQGDGFHKMMKQTRTEMMDTRDQIMKVMDAHLTAFKNGTKSYLDILAENDKSDNPAFIRAMHRNFKRSLAWAAVDAKTKSGQTNLYNTVVAATRQAAIDYSDDGVLNGVERYLQRLPEAERIRQRGLLEMYKDDASAFFDYAASLAVYAGLGQGDKSGPELVSLARMTWKDAQANKARHGVVERKLIDTRLRQNPTPEMADPIAADYYANLVDDTLSSEMLGARAMTFFRDSPDGKEALEYQAKEVSKGLFNPEDFEGIGVLWNPDAEVALTVFDTPALHDPDVHSIEVKRPYLTTVTSGDDTLAVAMGGQADTPLALRRKINTFNRWANFTTVAMPGDEGKAIVLAEAKRLGLDGSKPTARPVITYNTGDIEARIKDHEGDKLSAYIDADGVSIGHGLRIDTEEGKQLFMQTLRVDEDYYNKVLSGRENITPSQRERLFTAYMPVARADALRVVPDLADHPLQVQEVVLNMAYIFGRSNLEEWNQAKGTLQAIKSRNYRRAAALIPKSKWYKTDAPNRAKAMVALLNEADAVEMASLGDES